ncbi:MAG: hypothetical protein WAL31_02460 [Gaiellaceae bacterium]
MGSEFTRLFISRGAPARPISRKGIFYGWEGSIVDIRAEISTRLRRAEGFSVETASGRLGTVAAFQDGGGSGMTDLLVVQAGWRGRRRILISVDDVAAVRPREEVVQLRSKWMTIQT